MLKVLIVEDHNLVRDGIAMVLQLLDEEVTPLFASTCSSALDVVRANRDLDLILLDLGLPDRDGFSSLADLRACDELTPVMVVSADCRPDSINRVLKEGARGFVPKHAGKDVFLTAVRLVLSGSIYIPPEALDCITKINSANPLTPRQRAVLELIGEGKSNKRIAHELSMAEATVRQHVTAIFRSLGVSNRTEAALKARNI